jgi:hypothetical protein
VEIWEEEKGKENNPPPKNKVLQDLEQNEENRYPDPDSNKTNYTKESNKADKNTLNKEILQIINENFIQMLLDMVNQTYRRHSRNAKRTKTKIMRKHGNK